MAGRHAPVCTAAPQALGAIRCLDQANADQRDVRAAVGTQGDHGRGAMVSEELQLGPLSESVMVPYCIFSAHYMPGA